MKYLHGPILMLATFVIGVAISPIHFYLEGMGCGRVIDGGGGFSITSHRSSYFVNLSFAHSQYVSTEKANAVFDQRLREADRVIEVTAKLNRQGVSVGRRAVAIYFEPEVNQYFARVFWTDGRVLHSINSTSLVHVIDFEKQYLRANED